MHIVQASLALLALLFCGLEIAKGALDDPEPPDSWWNTGVSTGKPTGTPGPGESGGSGGGGGGTPCQSKQCSLYNGTTKYVSTRGTQTGLWIINDKDQLLQMDTRRNTWMKELDNVVAVAVEHDGTVWAACKEGSGGQFLTRKKPHGMAISRWQHIGLTRPYDLTYISASNASDGEDVVGLDSQGRVLQYFESTRQWEVVFDTGSSKWISMDADRNVYSVGKGDHAVYYLCRGWRFYGCNGAVKLKDTYADTVDAYSKDLRLCTDYDSRVYVWINGTWKQQPFRADQAVITKEGVIYYVYRGILGSASPK